MYESSSDQDTFQDNYLQQDNSVNQTAISFRANRKTIQVQDNGQANSILSSFYSKKLRIDAQFKFDDLESVQQIFGDKVEGFYPPEPLLYFLPYTIIVKPNTNLVTLRDNIVSHYQKQSQQEYLQKNINLQADKQQLHVRIHSSKQIVIYKIKKAKLDLSLHKYPDCLDGDLLVDRLYNFYRQVYKGFHFEEVGSLFMYWAHKKGFLGQNCFTQSALKLLFVALFMRSYLGVSNVLTSYKKHFCKKQKKCLDDAVSCNGKGQCQVSKDILNYSNYSIKEKRGFYIVSQKKFQLIKDIYPVFYPIGQRQQNKSQVIKYKEKELEQFTKKARSLSQKLKDKESSVTLYNLLFKIFDKMHEYMNLPNKIVVDFKKDQVFSQQNSQGFELQIQHPVFTETVGENLRGSAAKRVRYQLSMIIQKVKDNDEQASQNLLYLFGSINR